jgi:hypothetical protein
MAMAFLAPAAGAVVGQTPSGRRMSLMFRPGAKAPGPGKSTSGVLQYHRGPVLASETSYLIYWAPGGFSTGSGTPPSYSIPQTSATLLNQYMTDVAAASAARSTTNVYSVLAQYNTPYSQTFSGAQAVLDTDPYPTNQSGCSLAPGLTACVTDASIQSEVANFARNNKIATWPSTGPKPIFFVITPVDVNVCLSGGQCEDNSFCAYHDFFSSNGSDVLYSSVPFAVFADGNTKGCQTDQYSIYESPAAFNGDEAYNIADDLSHELSETITDPLINAWYSKNGLEVGDLCEAYAATANTSQGLSPLAYSPAFGNAGQGILYDQVINGDQYYNQTEFSNKANKCQAGLTAL